jgi:myo-inositol-hexaphosphate 3-phosphohydrolase
MALHDRQKYYIVRWSNGQTSEPTTFTEFQASRWGMDFDDEYGLKMADAQKLIDRWNSESRRQGVFRQYSLVV